MAECAYTLDVATLFGLVATGIHIDDHSIELDGLPVVVARQFPHVRPH